MEQHRAFCSGCWLPWAVAGVASLAEGFTGSVRVATINLFDTLAHAANKFA